MISNFSKSPDSSARNGSLNSSGASVSGNPRESVERNSLILVMNKKLKKLFENLIFNFISKGEKFRTIKLDNLGSLSTRVGHKVSDSGYVSHSTEETLPFDSAFSEQPVNAFLKPNEFKGKNSIPNP